MLNRITVVAALAVTFALLGTATRVRADDKATEPSAGTEQYVRRALYKTVAIDVTDKPLVEVADDLAKQANVVVEIDRRALEAEGLDVAEAKVSASLKNLPLRSCLRVILRELELTYTIDEGVLLITTPEGAERHLNTAVLDVSDLQGTEVGAAPQDTDYGILEVYDVLAELITTTVAEESWDEVGGSGTIYGFRGTIVLCQTDEIIDQIRQLLAAIRQGKQLIAKHGDSPPPVTSIYAEDNPQARERVEKALDSKFDFEVMNVEVVRNLCKKYPIRLCEAKLLEAIVPDIEKEVTFSKRNITLRDALRRWLREAGLASYFYEGVLMISTPEDAEQNLAVRVYPVQDLVEQVPRSRAPWGLNNEADEAPYWDYDDLIDLTCVIVQPNTWDCLGGPGSISELWDDGLLVISQTEEVHKEIQRLYTKLRKTVPAAAKKPLAKPADEDLRTAVYSVPATYTEFGAEEHVNPSEREVLKLITSIIEPESWRKRDEVYAHSIKERLIIRHTNAVHRKIRELASKLEISGFREIGVYRRTSPYRGCISIIPVVGDKQLGPTIQNDSIRR